MHTHQPKQQGYGSYSQAPADLYSAALERGRLQMEDYSGHVSRIQSAYSDMYSSMYRSLLDTMQSWMGPLQSMTAPTTTTRRSGCHEHEQRCHRCGQTCDCHCTCCISDADAVEYVRCGELRVIPITFDNDTRRERDVTLQLSAFATSDGKELGWKAELPESSFKLPPCGQKTVLLRVPVDCNAFQGKPDRQSEGNRLGSVDQCRVAYATLRAEGCLVRPIVIAIAVLPNDCGAHVVGCQCGCCC